VEVLVSQPLVRKSLSQFEKPALQVPVHVPETQFVEAMLLVLHTRLQPPQLLVEVCKFASHPSKPKLLLQSAKFGRHTPVHWPPTQVELNVLVPAHVFPQKPQLELHGVISFGVSSTLDLLLPWQRHRGREREREREREEIVRTYHWILGWCSQHSLRDCNRRSQVRTLECTGRRCTTC